MKRKGSPYTLQEISEYAGVSTATVSRAVNHPERVKEKTRDQVVAALNALGVSVQSLRSAPQADDRKPVILIINRAFDDNIASNEFYKGMLEVAERHGYIFMNVVADTLAKMSDQMIGHLLEQFNVRGILVNVRLDAAMLTTLSASVPLVQMTDTCGSFDSCIVAPDFYKGASETVSHLIAQSCHTIAAVLMDTGVSDSSAMKKRAYCDALRRAGMPIRPEHIIELPKVDFQMAINAVSSLLKHNADIDGLFCGTDLYAAAALSICQQFDINVPDTIKITGFDDTLFSSVTVPKLTTTRYDRFYAGYMGCELLIKRILNPELPSEIITLDHELIIRGSSMGRYQSPAPIL